MSSRIIFSYIPIVFGPTGNSAIRSADPENPNLQNQTWSELDDPLRRYMAIRFFSHERSVTWILVKWWTEDSLCRVPYYTPVQNTPLLTRLYDCCVACVQRKRWHGNGKDSVSTDAAFDVLLREAEKLPSDGPTDKQQQSACPSSCRPSWPAKQHLSGRHAYRLTNYYIMSAAATEPPP